jgi:virulence-associated protein E
MTKSISLSVSSGKIGNFIELGELSAFSRGEVNQIKAFMSRSVDTYRTPYGRMPADFPRQCVFFGSTNNETYLKDETGNRRFWPVAYRPVVGRQVDLAGLEADRDQLWAEPSRCTRTATNGIWTTSLSFVRPRRRQWTELSTMSGNRLSRRTAIAH